MKLNETLRTIHRLRSIHGFFSDKEISRESLETILNACVRAATASARQSYSIIVVEDRAVIKEYILPPPFPQDFEGSKALLFCVDYNRLVNMARYLNHSFHGNETGIIAFITGTMDTLLAAQTAAIAAKSLGIDSLFTNSIHRQSLDIIYKQFGLPEKHCFPLITLVLGYAAKEPKHLKGRLRKGVIHYTKYHHLTDQELEELVQEYDDPERHLWLSAYERTGKDKEFPHYLDWFYTRWSARSGKRLDQYAEKLREFYEMLKRAGFLEGLGG
jgi:nitroreductase